MNKIIVSIVILISAIISKAQNIDHKTTTQLYTKTIENYFNKTTNSVKNNSIHKPTFLIIGNNLPENLPLDYNAFTLKIVKDQNEAINEIDNAHEKTGSVFIISRKFKKDTIDINVGTLGIRIKKTFKIQHWHLITRQIFLSVNCGGTIGYIPSGRMTYNKESKLWSFISGEEVFAEMKMKNPYL
jgi:hypothetical protein